MIIAGTLNIFPLAVLFFFCSSIQFNSAQTPDTRHSRWSYAARLDRLFSVCWRKTQNLNYFWVKFLRQSSVLELPDHSAVNQSVSLFSVLCQSIAVPSPTQHFSQHFEHLLPAADRQTLMRQLMGGNRVLSQTHSFNRL